MSSNLNFITNVHIQLTTKRSIGEANQKKLIKNCFIRDNFANMKHKRGKPAKIYEGNRLFIASIAYHHKKTLKTTTVIRLALEISSVELNVEFGQL